MTTNKVRVRKGSKQSSSVTIFSPWIPIKLTYLAMFVQGFHKLGHITLFTNP